MSLSSLLFVAPTLPAEAGNGLAMRAGVFLDALAHDFAITLLVAPVAGGPVEGIPAFIAERTRRTVVISLEDKLDPLWGLIARVLDHKARAKALIAYPRPALCRYATTPCLQAVADAVASERFDALHVMRSYLAPYLTRVLPQCCQAGPVTSLDLDDDEPSTHRRLAALHRHAERWDDEQIELAEAQKYEALEGAVFGYFPQRIITAMMHPHLNTLVVPNTVALPPLVQREKRSTRRLLFLGNLSYLPNVEGIRAFATTVLPELHRTLGSKVVLRIVGSSPVAAVTALATRPGIEIVANPPEVATHYAWADLAVVPLSAGGGTRIKLLEAFAHQVPVVATSIGAEGIAVVDKEHLLLADTPATLATACARLLTDRPYAEAMADRARQLVAMSYSHSVGREAVRAALRLAALH